jgi:hypothetical protein
MARKRSGQLTVLGEWARHLRPVLRRKFWKGERQAERVHLLEEAAQVQAPVESEKAVRPEPRS